MTTREKERARLIEELVTINPVVFDQQQLQQLDDESLLATHRSVFPPAGAEGDIDIAEQALRLLESGDFPDVASARLHTVSVLSNGDQDQLDRLQILFETTDILPGAQDIIIAQLIDSRAINAAIKVASGTEDIAGAGTLLEQEIPETIEISPRLGEEIGPTATDPGEGLVAEEQVEQPLEDPDDPDDPLLSEKEQQRRRELEQQQALADQLAELEQSLSAESKQQLDTILQEFEREKQRRQDIEQARGAQRVQPPVVVVNQQNQSGGGIEDPSSVPSVPSVSQMLDDARTKFTKGKLGPLLDFPVPSSNLILGKSGSGKTNLLKIMLQNIRNRFSRIVLISQTAGFTRDFEEFVFPDDGPKLEIISELEDMEDIDVITKAKQARDILNLNWLIIFDDIIGFVNLHLRSNVMKRLITSARHSGISMIMLSQKFKEIPPIFRSNLTRLFVFNITQNELKAVHSEVGAGLSDIRPTPFFRFVKRVLGTMSFSLVFDFPRGEWYLLKIPLYDPFEGQSVQVLTELFADTDDGSRSEIEERLMPISKGRKLKFNVFLKRFQEKHPLLSQQQAMEQAERVFMRGAVMIL